MDLYGYLQYTEIVMDEGIFVEQRYERYTPSDHETWRVLYERMIPLWNQHANPAYLKGISALNLDPNHIPRLEDINRFLQPLTGFRARAVRGYLPPVQFFECLRDRVFPTTITVRDAKQLDYLPEPDIFHDVAGHVPMHTDPAFAETLVRFGRCALEASSMYESESLQSVSKALARFFWFTIEFGLMNTKDGLKAYGSGLLSSHGELEHSLESADVQRSPFLLEWAINQSFEIDHYQPLLFIVDGFDHLYDLVGTLEAWMKDGKLCHVAPGEPQVVVP